MYFATDTKADNVETYVYFLSELIKNENDYYRNLFSKIVSEAQDLIASKNYYSVSSEIFHVVKLLSDNPEAVVSIQPDNLTKNDYRKLSELLIKEAELA